MNPDYMDSGKVLKENDNALKGTNESPKVTLPLPHVATLSEDDFLARVNMNDKINSILRSPSKTPKSVRQRSVYTGINTSSRLNTSATYVAHSRTSASASTPTSAPAISSFVPTSSTRASVINNSFVTSKEAISASRHQSHNPSHVNTLSSLYHYGNSNYENSGVRPARHLMAPPPSPIYNYDNDMVRMPPIVSPGINSQQFPQPMPPPPFIMGRSSTHRIEYENLAPAPCPGAGPIAMSNGTIQLRLREGIRIDMTLDRAVRVLNQRSMVAIALSRNCTNSALIHPNGRVLQSGSKVEIVTYDGTKSNNYVRYAKMWYKGVSFTSDSCALIYLVDTAGTRTTTDTFTDLTKDYTLTVFYDDSRHGPTYVHDANDVIQNSTYTCTDEGTEVYDINGFRITQAADGLVKLTRTHNKCLIRTSPGNGSATLTTPGIHCTASLGKTSHLFVRRNEKRMHFDGSCFIVRNAGHSAGFNESNLLIVY
ncbi:uncharacterized protein LOC119678654 [Teleopsis dalmanni]|uniref:uncharacterized protein LOC119678654 n=1 Tax=Teleopsis dalmanni TaxID=139649 RepID=UPI0018CE8790|nr:uncharacterized protein LOC119678654 [Teleopsis dalmanni]XP_037946551.1 uncharacterized protein LOC119678654 [Teleopsis dalmanni]